MQTVELAARVGSELDQRALLAFVEDSEDRRIGPAAGVGSLDRAEDTTPGEVHHMAYQGNQDQVGIPVGQTAG